MAESVGTDCKCIYSFEKHYIDMLFGERIEKEKENLAQAEAELSKLPPEARERFRGVPGGYKLLINDLETVRERFIAMPDCKQ